MPGSKAAASLETEFIASFHVLIAQRNAVFLHARWASSFCAFLFSCHVSHFTCGARQLGAANQLWPRGNGSGLWMSAVGQTRSLPEVRDMIALPPQADLNALALSGMGRHRER
jgi:hypothetical protein